MLRTRTILGIAGSLLLLATTANAQGLGYVLTGPTTGTDATGGQLQIGSGLPLPIQVFTLGRMSPGTGFPPVLVPRAAPSDVIRQGITSPGLSNTPAGGALS